MFKGVNKVMRAYIYWDLIINSAWGLFGPVFAIFILQNIAVGNVADGAKIAGFAMLFYWIVKSILQIPIGNYLDKNHGEIDDFWFFAIGAIITGLVPFGFLFANLPWHIYALEVLHAVGMAMVIPSSYAIFIRHADKGKEAFESGLDSTLMGVGAGITGAVGGIVAGYFGFVLIFILAGTFTLLSVFFIFWVKDDMLPRVSKGAHPFPISKDAIESE
jgi:predicted MFS family arabinose efflux permease